MFISWCDFLFVSGSDPGQSQPEVDIELTLKSHSFHTTPTQLCLKQKLKSEDGEDEHRRLSLWHLKAKLMLETWLLPSDHMFFCGTVLQPMYSLLCVYYILIPYNNDCCSMKISLHQVCFEPFINQIIQKCSFQQPKEFISLSWTSLIQLFLPVVCFPSYSMSRSPFPSICGSLIPQGKFSQ